MAAAAAKEEEEEEVFLLQRFSALRLENNRPGLRELTEGTRRREATARHFFFSLRTQNFPIHIFAVVVFIFFWLNICLPTLTPTYEGGVATVPF